MNSQIPGAEDLLATEEHYLLLKKECLLRGIAIKEGTRERLILDDSLWPIRINVNHSPYPECSVEGLAWHLAYAMYLRDLPFVERKRVAGLKKIATGMKSFREKVYNVSLAKGATLFCVYIRIWREAISLLRVLKIPFNPISMGIAVKCQIKWCKEDLGL